MVTLTTAQVAALTRLFQKNPELKTATLFKQAEQAGIQVGRSYFYALRQRFTAGQGLPQKPERKERKQRALNPTIKGSRDRLNWVVQNVFGGQASKLAAAIRATGETFGQHVARSSKKAELRSATMQKVATVAKAHGVSAEWVMTGIEPIRSGGQPTSSNNCTEDVAAFAIKLRVAKDLLRWFNNDVAAAVTAVQLVAQLVSTD